MDGPLPSKYLQAFKELQSQLCSNPITMYPHHDQCYCLTTHVIFGSDLQLESFGADLTQTDLHALMECYAALLMPAKSPPRRRKP